MKSIVSVPSLILSIICLFFTACADRMDTEMATGLIEAHPYLSEYHVGITDRVLDNCEPDYISSKKNAYITLRGANKTAHYYKMNNLKISEIHDLTVDNGTARCEVVLVADNITQAGEKVNDVRPGKEGERFTIEFRKHENIGWRIHNFEPHNNLFFLNIWRGEGLVFRVTPDYYSM